MKKPDEIKTKGARAEQCLKIHQTKCLKVEFSAPWKSFRKIFWKLEKKHKQMNRRFKRVVNKNGKEQGSYVDIQKHGLDKSVFQLPSAKAENCE